MDASPTRERNRRLDLYLKVWQGETPLAELDTMTTDGYVGYTGSRSRDLAGLKADIAAYLAASPSARFTVEHRFGQGDFIATRLSARAAVAGAADLVAAGLNISRWEDDLLAEEWAVWEPLHTADA